jgi:hypothetical protein
MNIGKKLYIMLILLILMDVYNIFYFRIMIFFRESIYIDLIIIKIDIYDLKIKYFIHLIY